MDKTEYWKTRKKELSEFVSWICDFKNRIQDDRNFSIREYILVKKFDMVLVQVYDAIMEQKKEIAKRQLACLTQIVLELYYHQ